MNPWDILVWVLVACLALLAIMVTLAIVAGAVRGIRRRPERSTTIVRPSGRQR